MPKLKDNEKEFAEAKGNSMNIPCCPELEKDKGCDYLDFRYRLIHYKKVVANKQEYTIPVEVLLKARLQRCHAGMALGDLVYSTTLFPGEKVRLFSQDRRTKFSYDSESSLSYRHQQTSEERYYMSSMSHFMSDLNQTESATASSESSSSWKGGGETSGAIESFFLGADVDVKGSHSGSSTSSFLRELKQHSEASHNASVQAVRTANSVSIGEVQSRTHQEGETESHYESASRTFSNPNRCHAITYLFYQIAKIQVVKFNLLAVQMRVLDSAGNTRVTSLPPKQTGEISVVPDAILATNKNRLEIEAIGQKSVSNAASGVSYMAKANLAMVNNQMIYPAQMQTPIDDSIKEEAIHLVREDLIKQGLIDKKDGQLTEQTKLEFSFEFRTSLPTAGIIVKGCLDSCDTCEPVLKQEIKLELENMKLQNALLEKQIELLEKSQEYRCCPQESSDEDDGD